MLRLRDSCIQWICVGVNVMQYGKIYKLFDGLAAENVVSPASLLFDFWKIRPVFSIDYWAHYACSFKRNLLDFKFLICRRQLQEQCKLVLEENEILMKQLEVQEDKYNQRHKADVQEGWCYTSNTHTLICSGVNVVYHRLVEASKIFWLVVVGWQATVPTVKCWNMVWITYEIKKLDGREKLLCWGCVTHHVKVSQIR